MKIVVIGACNIDYLVKTIDTYKLKDSNPSKIEINFGGVGKNIAHNLANLGFDVVMLSVVSNDENGKALLNHLNKIGIDTSRVKRSDTSSSIYISINSNDGELVIGASCMDIANEIDENYLIENEDLISKADYIVFDTNIPSSSIAYIQSHMKSKIICDAVSTTKVKKLQNLRNIFLLKVNELEAKELYNKKDFSYEKAAFCFHELGVENVCISLGGKGVFYSSLRGDVLLPSMADKIVNTNGAGDALLSGLVYGIAK